MFTQDVESYERLPKFPLREIKYLRIYQCLKDNGFNRSIAAAELSVSIRMIRIAVDEMKESGVVIPDADWKTRRTLHPRKPRKPKKQ